ncbi:alternative ribosome rescue aminoacyl-tRNA hydrolase ArfB [Flavobacteriales bacterium]|nr:alternative ribosome rescue aminoacyl-tRNA hydrolase ArfB [Flavobacteriales bacterium]MDC3336881.1 alternative ribosome rescue aminoacyl-tRNA hydrolase ArfB [Flavobacteriales bacterium]
MVDADALSKEVNYLTARSKGSGGQHVNKVETKVTLVFSLVESNLLDSNQKQLLRENIGNKINTKGNIQVTAQKYNSQIKNKVLCFQKFIALMNEGLKVKKKRKKHRLSNTQKEKRLKEKKRRANIKEFRKRINE